MNIKAEIRIEINVRDREMYGTYETESEYRELQDYSTHQFHPEIKYQCNAYNKTYHINIVTYQFRWFCEIIHCNPLQK